jgi:hypothetical protein
MARLLWTLVKCLLAVVVVGNLGVLAYWINQERTRQRQQDATGDKVQTPSFLENNFVKLNAKLAESYGLETEPALAYRFQERIEVLGRVVPNPRATFEVRSPFPGTLQLGADPWPAPGQCVRAGQVLGRIVIRVGPQERIDFLSKLTEARLKQKGAEEVCKLRQSVVDRLATTRSGAVAQRDLDEAKVQLAEAQTQLATAKAAVAVWQQALEEIDQPGTGEPRVWSRPLLVPAEGGASADLEITELAGQPGMAVEAGGLVARVVDFSRPLVRLDFPADLLQAGPPPPEVELFAAPDRQSPQTAFKATCVGPASQVDASSQFAGYLYAVGNGSQGTPSAAHAVEREANRPSRSVWRPGLFVRARLPQPASSPQQAVTVPASALLFHQGRALVYVRVQPGKYERREVQVLAHEGERCILTARSPLNPIGIGPNEMVVTNQAQVLLSAEFRRDTDDD